MKKALMYFIIFELLLSVKLIAMMNNKTIPLEDITIKIIYDNYNFTKDLKSDWGFSCIIETNDKTILFDTGAKEHILLGNMQKAGINIKDIDIVVISHDHWDHTGGLRAVLEKNNNIELYLPGSIPQHVVDELGLYSKSVHVVDEATEIAPGIKSTGSLPTNRENLTEQSLIVETDVGVIVATGCSHSDITHILEVAKKMTNRNLLHAFGGFHLHEMNNEQLREIIKRIEEMEIQFISPSHCTGKHAINKFSGHFGKRFIPIGVGKEIGKADFE